MKGEPLIWAFKAFMWKSAEILKYVIKLMGSFNLQNKMRAIDSYGQRKLHVKFGAIWGKFCQAFHESFIKEDEVEKESFGAIEALWVHEHE